MFFTPFNTTLSVIRPPPLPLPPPPPLPNHCSDLHYCKPLCIIECSNCRICTCRDFRQVTYSVSNIVRWQRRLDFLIAHLTGKACSRLEPTTHAILRLAVHELVYQQLAPHAVSEHVNLAKQLVRPAAGNLVNGNSLKVSRHNVNCVVPQVDNGRFVMICNAGICNASKVMQVCNASLQYQVTQVQGSVYYLQLVILSVASRSRSEPGQLVNPVL